MQLKSLIALIFIITISITVNAQTDIRHADTSRPRTGRIAPDTSGAQNNGRSKTTPKQASPNKNDKKVTIQPGTPERMPSDPNYQGNPTTPPVNPNAPYKPTPPNAPGKPGPEVPPTSPNPPRF